MAKIKVLWLSEPSNQSKKKYPEAFTYITLIFKLLTHPPEYLTVQGKTGMKMIMMQCEDHRNEDTYVQPIKGREAVGLSEGLEKDSTEKVVLQMKLN